jgi:hypothetical protein
MERTEIRASTLWRLVSSSLFVVGLIYLLLQVGFEDLVFTIFFIILFATASAITLSYINGTRLVIDDRGISFRDPQLSLKLTLFPWQEIDSVTMDSFLGKGVVLSLRDAKQFKSQLSVPARFNLAIRRIIWRREFWIPLAGLDTKPEQVQSLILAGIEQYKLRETKSEAT